MSETDDTQREKQAVEVAPAPDEAPEEVSEPAPETEPEPKPRRSGAGAVAWLALLLSVGACLAVGYTIYEDWRSAQALAVDSGNIEASLTRLDRRIASASEDLADTQSAFDALSDVDADMADELDELEREIAEQLRRLEALPNRVSNTEAALAALQGVSAGARDTWLLGEAEYYMQLANAQLQLANNPKMAALALGVADERIAQLADPALTAVRVAIADEIAALGGMVTPDIAGITLKLASVARSVDEMPLRPIKGIDDAADEESEEQTGRFSRAWNAVKEEMSGLIKHRTTDRQLEPLMAPQAEYFLRTNLTLQLQTARLALLRGEQSVFRQSLADAADWIEQYFDPDDRQVEYALETIADIKDGAKAVTPPDISESLRLLRQFTSVSESAQ